MTKRKKISGFFQAAIVAVAIFCCVFFLPRFVYKTKAASSEMVLDAGGGLVSANPLSWKLSDSDLKRLDYIRVGDTAVKTNTFEGWIAQYSVWAAEKYMWAKKFFNDIGGSKALNAAIKQALNTIAYDTATWIGSGGTGGKPLFITEGWGEYLTNVADQSAGSFIEALGRYGPTKFNLCQPSGDIQLRIALGLTKYTRPKAPACTFSKMLNNWEAALQSPNFLNDFQNMFDPASNDLGIALSLQTELLEYQNLQSNFYEKQRNENKGWLDITDITTGRRTSIPQAAEKAVSQVADTYGASLLTFTGDALVDAVNVFINQLAITAFRKLMSELGKNASTYTSPYSGNYGLYDPISSARSGGQNENIRKLLEPKFDERGDYNILAELTTCPDPNMAGPSNCVITDRFRQAIINKKTVGEAMDEGYLKAGGIFAFRSGGSLEPNYYDDDYPYRSMVILRTYRILPVGWEIAGQYIADNSPKGSSGEGVTLKDLIDCFDPDDGYAGYDQAWCRGLVDPNWVLKAPLNYCKKEGYGPELLSSQIVGTGSESSIAVTRKDGYCADNQSCIKEKKDGSCELYGYCVEEKRIWKFSDSSCDGKYNTCQTFSRSDGSTVSYLKNTLDFAACEAGNVGCSRYALGGSYSSSSEEVNWDGDNSIYLNSNAASCGIESEGCSGLIRTKKGTGANLLINGSFESDLSEGGWAVYGSALDEGFAGSRSLQLSSDLIKNVQTGLASGYGIAGEAYTFSFYGKNCGDNSSASVGGKDFSFDSGADWTRFSGSFVYSPEAAGSSVNIEIRPSASGSCLIDALSLTRGVNLSPYSDYGSAGLIYEKLIPAYLSNVCYQSANDFRLKDDAPAVCSNFARKCNADEADCELYTSLTSGFNVPARVTDADYCAAECVGYDLYLQAAAGFENSRADYFIPATASSCSAENAGCDEFTNLDKLGAGAEARGYYSSLKQCVKPDAGICAEFYSWEGSDESGYQLKSFTLKKDAAGNPAVAGASEEACNEEIFNLAPGDPAYNPECRQFYNQAGGVSYHPIDRVISCSDNCHPLRRTATGDSAEEQVNCAAGGGEWRSGYCVYMAIPEEGTVCSATAVGCREYSGSRGNNVKTVLTEDFENGGMGWSGENGTTVGISNESLNVGGHSLLVQSGGRQATLTVGKTVKNGSSYTLAFLAKSQSNNTSLEIRFEDWSGASKSAGSVNLRAGEWRYYQLNLDNIGHSITDSEKIVFDATADFYLDGVKLNEIVDRYYLIKNSWRTPASCDQDANQNVSARFAVGCDEYRDRDNNLHYLKSFSRLCRDSAVGCELMIDTKNYSSPQGKIWNDKNGDGVCSADEPDCVKVGSDSFVYAVYDRDKLCNGEDKGCGRLGLAASYGGENYYSDVYIKNNPDRYDQTLCGAGDVGCAAWQTASGVYYFKDPGDQVCEWRQTYGSNIWGWYQKQVKKCGGTGKICSSDGDCSYGAACVLDERNLACPGDGSGAPKTIGEGGRRIVQPSGGWVGLCPASESGCTEYIDPVSKPSANIFSSAGVQSFSRFTLYALKNGSVGGCLDADNNSAAIYLLDGNNQLVSVASVSAPAGETKLFYTASAEKCSVSGSSAELRKTVVDYQLKQNTDKSSCNGLANFDEGCALFNEREVFGNVAASLVFNADATGNRSAPAVSGDKDSNSLIKVSPDRICGQWLACRSAVSAKNEKGEEERVCFDIGACDAMDESGQCANFVSTSAKEQTVLAEKSSDYAKYLNYSGYSKVGLFGIGDYSMRGQYPAGASSQVGAVASVSNGNFEIYGSNLYPIGWATDSSAAWTANNFSVIANPIAAQSEAVRYPVEGRAFLKYSAEISENFGVYSEALEAEPGSEYILSFQINTLKLKSKTGSTEVKAKIRIDGAVNSEAEAVTAPLGHDWERKVKKFTAASSLIRVYLETSGSDPVGTIYIDDIKIKPALNNKDNFYTPQSCRLYPEADSLSCDYYKDTGAREKGLWGYCLEYDRYPGSSDSCLLWWPADKIKGDGIEEGAGYSGKTPVYYCVDYEYDYDLPDFVKSTTVANYGFTYSGGMTRWRSKVNGGKNNLYYVLENDYSLARYNGESEYNFIQNPVGAGGDFKVQFLSSNYTVDPTREYFLSDVSGSAHPPELTVNSGNLIILVYHHESGQASSQFSLIDKATNQPVFIWSGSIDHEIKIIFSEPPKQYCAKVAMTASVNGANKYWSGRVYEGSAFNIPCVSFSNGSYRLAMPVNSSCGYSSDSTPFGSIVPPSGSLSALSNPYEWDSVTSKDGNQPLYYDLSQSSARTGQIHYQDQLRRIFAKSYGGWVWSGDANSGHYILNDNINWNVPSVECSGGIRPASGNDYCFVRPIVSGVNANLAQISKSGYVNLKFNSIVDSQQLPLISYKVEWGDETETVVSGVEMRDRPSADNPHSLYHLYDYWDLKIKGLCSGEICAIRPTITIKDNWGKEGFATGPAITIREK